MISFAPPRIDEKTIEAVSETLRSGWITTGPKTKLLEKKISEYCDVIETLCVNSATAGMELALRWFGVGPDDEVILPAYTYAATANVVIHCGAKPIMVDVNKNDFCISIEAIEKAITSKTKVIMPVDFGGLPCDYDAISALIEKVKNKFNPAYDHQEMLGRIMILADAAHSLGAIYKGRNAGTLADISVFSFHAVKNLTTAEGGAILFNLPAPFDNSVIYKELSITSLHGQTKDAIAKMQKGNWKYDIVEAGYKCNMTDLAATIGLIELDRYKDDTIPKRKAIVDAYHSYFSKYSWAELPISKDEKRESSYHLFALRIKNITEEQRDKIVQKIFDRDVSVNVHFIPIPMMSFYKNLGYKMSDYPVTYDNFSREISLPIYYDLTTEQIDIVTNAVKESVEEII